ncbi:hypothetical protein AB0948_12185 [Streptomyces koyangensis]|uniref:hypothetical protein n=1 Tax=Streptomyces koyangensis TaxID=188770 RepID=UPI003451D326
MDLPYAGPDFDLDSWTTDETARIAERYAAEGQRAAPRQIARTLRAITKDSATRGTLGAFALYLSGFDTTLALVELDAILPDETAPEVTPRWVADLMATDEVAPPKNEKGLIRLVCSCEDFALDEVLIPMVDEMAESLAL